MTQICFINAALFCLNGYSHAYVYKSKFLQPRKKCRLYALSPAGCSIPFWLLATTTESDDSNMSLQYIKGIPCAKSTRDIESGEELVLLKEKTEKRFAPLSFTGPAPPPAKKKKASA